MFVVQRGLGCMQQYRGVRGVCSTTGSRMFTAVQWGLGCMQYNKVWGVCSITPGSGVYAVQWDLGCMQQYSGVWVFAAVQRGVGYMQQ